MDDKISIIVPIYNVEKYLNKCVDSLLNQTYKNLEIILVDDGSPDNCFKICEDYSKNENIVVIHKENGGLSDARNYGLKEASGKYVMFIDSDDFVENDMVEYLYKILKDNNADVSICNYNLFYEDNSLNNKIGVEIESDLILNKYEALNLLLEDKIIQSFAWNKLYKRTLFDGITYPKGKIMEDVGTTYKLFTKAEKIVVGKEPKYNYLQRSGSILHHKKAKYYIDYFDLSYKRYKDLIKENKKLENNYLKMLYLSFDILLVEDENVQEYLMQIDIMKIINDIYSKMNEQKIVLPRNAKIKKIILKKSKGAYIRLFRGWNKWILKKVDYM